jgi:hypothetical protein
VAERLPQVHAHLLNPLGIAVPADDIDTAIAAFVKRRDALEREYGISVPKDLENEVLDGGWRVRRHG